MTHTITDEAWLDIKARALIKIDEAKRNHEESLPDIGVEPEDWTDEEFDEMEAWAHEVFQPLRDAASVERVKVAVLAEIGDDLK